MYPLSRLMAVLARFRYTLQTLITYSYILYSPDLRSAWMIQKSPSWLEMLPLGNELLHLKQFSFNNEQNARNFIVTLVRPAYDGWEAKNL